MKRPFVLFLLCSLSFHLLIFFISSSVKRSFELPLVKGEPVFVSKSGEAAVGPAKSSNGSLQTTATPRGITDGAEFGIKKPPYPESSRLRGEEGKVLLKLSLDSAKALVKAEVSESSGHTDLDRAALLQIERDLPTSQSGTKAFEHLIQFNFSLSAHK